ncbi:hypothetical protein LTR95_012949 [Oleoguttula sp. CCFEE 5521]
MASSQQVELRTAGTLVIGAGVPGLAVVDGLMKQEQGDPRLLSVLVRPPTNDTARRTLQTLEKKGVSIIHADLASNTGDDLATIFTVVDTVICCAGKINSSRVECCSQTGQDVWDQQADVRDMLRRQATTNWIIISTGMFTSFLFEPTFGVVYLAKGQVDALGSWDHRLTVTTPEDIGRLTAAILAQEPQIQDEVVYIAGDTFTYAHLADIEDGHLGRKVERTLWDTEHLRSKVAANPDDGMRKYHLAFARDSGVAWDEASTFNAQQGIAVTDVPTWLR